MSIFSPIVPRDPLQSFLLAFFMTFLTLTCSLYCILNKIIEYKCFPYFALFLSLFAFFTFFCPPGDCFLLIRFCIFPIISSDVLITTPHILSFNSSMSSFNSSMSSFTSFKASHFSSLLSLKIFQSAVLNFHLYYFSICYIHFNT